MTSLFSWWWACVLNTKLVLTCKRFPIFRTSFLCSFLQLWLVHLFVFGVCRISVDSSLYKVTSNRWPMYPFHQGLLFAFPCNWYNCYRRWKKAFRKTICIASYRCAIAEAKSWKGQIVVFTKDWLMIDRLRLCVKVCLSSILRLWKSPHPVGNKQIIINN